MRVKVLGDSNTSAFVTSRPWPRLLEDDHGFELEYNAGAIGMTAQAASSTHRHLWEDLVEPGDVWILALNQNDALDPGWTANYKANAGEILDRMLELGAADVHLVGAANTFGPSAVQNVHLEQLRANVFPLLDPDFVDLHPLGADCFQADGFHINQECQHLVAQQVAIALPEPALGMLFCIALLGLLGVRKLWRS